MDDQPRVVYSSPTAHFTIQCWGCNKAVTHPYSNHDDIQRQIELLKVAGWKRREFGPGASPWFCGDDCANNSYNAKRAEEWWATKKYQENAERNKALTILAIGILALIPMFCLSMGWCN